MILSQFDSQLALDYEFSTPMYATDTVTGSIKELTRVVQYDSSTGNVLTTTYTLLDGTPYVPAVTEQVASEPLRIVLGKEVVASIGNVAVGLGAIPANAKVAELQAHGGAIKIAVSGVPSAAVADGYKIANGGVFELESRSEIVGLRMIELFVGVPGNVYATYYNIAQRDNR